MGADNTDHNDHDGGEARILAETRQERLRLLSLVEGLTPEQWDTPSLCAGWRVREVVAHLTMPGRVSVPRMLAGIALAGFSFTRYADRAARTTAGSEDPEALIEDLRAHVDSTWRPPGEGPAAALSHDVIHGLDITEPLGLPRPPADRIRLVLENTSAKQVAYFGVDLQGRTVRAAEFPYSIGAGASVRTLPAAEVLLTLTGRSRT